MIISPFEQFDIVNYFSIIGYQVTITNSLVFTLLAVSLMYLLFYTTVKNEFILSRGWQQLAESIYLFIFSLIQENIPGNKGFKYFPLIFLVFNFILFCNLLGMIPYSFTVTSHIIATFTLGFSLFTGVTILGLVRHNYRFFSLFYPPDIPLAIVMILVPVEVITYLSRAVSLPVRLFANLMSGHILLKILAGFGSTMLSSKTMIINIFGVLPIAFIVIITGLELGIAFLQAYVFTVLITIYINDSIYLH